MMDKTEEELFSKKKRRKRRGGSSVDQSLSLLDKKEKKEKVEEDGEEVEEKYSRGEGLEGDSVKNKILRQKLLDREEDIKYSEHLSAQTELLRAETPGFVEVEDGVSRRVTQKDIRQAVDITSAAKQFSLALSFGPYRMDYTGNGRHLVLGGKQGHVAAMDWITKRLMCEINVMEAVFDVQWLHVETMFAVAQKEWLYVYNNQGVELHTVQAVHRPLRLAFLPYHFLLAATTESGYIKWLDVTMGKVVAELQTNKGRSAVLRQNPYNAVLCTGHTNGVVCMWTPNTKKPVVSMLCHNSTVQTLAIDHTGMYMATGGCQRDLKIWDVRKLEGPLESYRLTGGSASDLAFSQTGLLASSSANTVQVYQGCHKSGSVKEPYLTHRTDSPVVNSQFCPFEDVLGLSTHAGFSSILIPGAGEANVDSLEVNPVRSTRQRQETEVRSLLDKIPSEMISLDPTVLSEVDLPTLQDKWNAKKQILFARAPDINYVPRKKKKQGNSLRRDQVKKIIQQDAKKMFYSKIAGAKEEMMKRTKDQPTANSVLDRFRPKHKKKK